MKGHIWVFMKVHFIAECVDQFCDVKLYNGTLKLLCTMMERVNSGSRLYFYLFFDNMCHLVATLHFAHDNFWLTTGTSTVIRITLPERDYMYHIHSVLALSIGRVIVWDVVYVLVFRATIYNHNHLFHCYANHTNHIRIHMIMRA